MRSGQNRAKSFQLQNTLVLLTFWLICFVRIASDIFLLLNYQTIHLMSRRNLFFGKKKFSQNDLNKNRN
jgi:hypothetical protein